MGEKCWGTIIKGAEMVPSLQLGRVRYPSEAIDEISPEIFLRIHYLTPKGANMSESQGGMANIRDA